MSETESTEADRARAYECARHSRKYMSTGGVCWNNFTALIERRVKLRED